MASEFLNLPRSLSPLILGWEAPLGLTLLPQCRAQTFWIGRPHSQSPTSRTEQQIPDLTEGWGRGKGESLTGDRVGEPDEKAVGWAELCLCPSRLKASLIQTDTLGEFQDDSS